MSTQKENLKAMKSLEGESKGNVYTEGCPLLLHYFALEHIPDCGKDLVSVVSPRMLKWAPIPQFKALKFTQEAFSGATNQMIIEVSPTLDNKYLLVGLTEDKAVTPKKTLLKKGT